MRRGAALALGVGALVGIEGVCRLAPPPDPRVPTGTPAAETITLEGDPWLLWQLRPGDRVEQGKPVHVNESGFRDITRGPKSGPRVMTVGDSSVYGFGVGDDEVFSSLVQDDLAGEVPGLAVIDGATPGWSTFQTLNMLDMRGWALDPDLLIVGNLWSDNNFDDFVDKELLASYAGFAETTGYRVRMLMAHSALFGWLDWELRVKPLGDRAKKVGWSMGGDGPKSGKRRVAINDYADNLDTLCDHVRRQHGGVLFVMLANREDVDPVSADPAWGPYRRVMQDAAARFQVPIIDVPALVRASGHSADVLFMDQMHPTALGHRLLADAVENVLRTRRWPQDRLEPALAGPHAVYVDPFEGRGIDPGPPTPRAGQAARVRVPDRGAGEGALWLVMTGPNGEQVGSVALGALDVPIVLPPTPVPTATFRLYFDRDGDGPTAGDEQRVIGPVRLGPAEILLTFVAP